MLFCLRTSAALMVLVLLSCVAQTGNIASVADFRQREEAYRANNLGVALMEQFNHKGAADEFRRALSLSPELRIARVNLAIALFNVPDYDQSLTEAAKALEIAPDLPQARYIIGLIARIQNRIDDAIVQFAKVLEADPQDVGTNINLAQIYIQQRKYAEASTLLRAALRSEPYNSTALYNLATTVLREGKREEGQQLMARFQALRNSGAGTSLGMNYLEQGRFAEALISTGAETELVDTAVPNVFFEPADIGLPKTDSTGKSGPAVSAVLFDFDLDGDADLAVSAEGYGLLRLYRNDGGRFADAGKIGGDPARPVGRQVNGIVAGDYDNDGAPDLLAFGVGRPTLYRQTGPGAFKDVSAEARLPQTSDEAQSGAFADVDHDGDLDIVLGGYQEKPNRLWRNNGNGTFSDITETAKIGLPGRAVSVVPTDFDNRRDLDLLILSPDGKPQLWQNLRDSSFRDVAAEVGLAQSGQWTCAAVGDFNKDSFTDFFLGRAGGTGVLAVSDGRGRFISKDAPKGTENALSAQFLDYDNDGLIDLLASTPNGPVASRNLGGAWTEAVPGPFREVRDRSDSGQILSADIDSDGDLDLLFAGSNGSLRYFRNRGGETNRSVMVRLAGRVSNKTGIGAKIDLRAGSLAQKLESYSASPSPAPAEVHVGLGKRDRADTVRIIWTSGIIQAETEFPPPERRSAAIRIEEIDRKPSSCPYLFAWNGDKFEFITDFLGGGEMAYSLGNGQFNAPDADEFVRLAGDQLRPRNGKYELRVTNELEEVLYLDHFRLTAVDHPGGTEIYPNEGMGIPTAGKSLIYTTANERPPVRASDAAGRDVTESIRERDGTYYDSFDGERIRGYAKPHELTLTIDDRQGYNGRTLLLLTGWTDYAFSSDNIAASQAGLNLNPPKLQVRDKSGNWQTVIESAGFSVGRPQTVVVDLTGKFLSASRDVRIVTNMKTYWDKIAVDTSNDGSESLVISSALPDGADLRERGFSREIKPDEKGPVLADYGTVLNDGRWKYFSGTFTRLGDVLRLVSEADDVFVISKTGDELALTFDAAGFRPLAPGMQRTFLLFGVGYSKEMDVNSASPDAVLPLPFKAMTKYPYDGAEEFPMTAEKRRIYEEYTTRSVRRVFPRVEAALVK